MKKRPNEQPEEDIMEDPAFALAQAASDKPLDGEAVQRPRRVAYLGTRTACPCGAVLLQDRLTPACRVTRTMPVVRDGEQSYRDRYMSCLRCGRSFVAREIF
jgi:hypothetical protein